MSNVLGRQTQVYLDDRDAAEFMHEVASKLGFVLVAARSASRTPALVDVEAADSSSLLVLGNHLDQLRSRHIPEQEHWLLDTRNNPAIDWLRFREKNGVLRGGRLFYEAQNHLAYDAWNKDESFVNAAESLRRQLRKWCANRDSWAWIGRSVHSRVADGTLELSPI